MVDTILPSCKGESATTQARWGRPQVVSRLAQITQSPLASVNAHVCGSVMTWTLYSPEAQQGRPVAQDGVGIPSVLTRGSCRLLRATSHASFVGVAARVPPRVELGDDLVPCQISVEVARGCTSGRLASPGSSATAGRETCSLRCPAVGA